MVIKNILKGFWNKFANKEKNLSNIRMNICNKCKDKDGAWCGICGCLLDAKTRVPEEHCPNNLW